MSFNWDFVDEICIISVKGAEARLERSLSRLETIGIPRERVTLISDIPRPNKKKAIWNNHRRAWQHFIENAPLRGLVFEDDVLASENLTPDQLKRVSSWTQENPDAFDVLFLGHWPTANLERVNDFMMKTSSLLAHAYILPTSIAKKIVDIEPPEGHAVDMDLLRRFPKAHAVYPMLFYQEEDVSSNLGRKQFINLRDANEFMERAAFEQKLWPSPSSLLSYLHLLRLAKGRVDLGAEVRQALLDIPHIVAEHLRTEFGNRPPY